MSDPYAEYRPGSTEPWTARFLATMVMCQQPHLLVETGTFEAKTTRLLIDAMVTYAGIHGAGLLSVENDHARAVAAREQLVGVLVPRNVGIQIIEEEAIAFLSHSELQGQVDFLFLDDNHDAAHVRRELELAQSLMRPGGVIAVHDVLGPFGLATVVKDFGGQILDFVRLHAAGGLGLIVKDS